MSKQFYAKSVVLVTKMNPVPNHDGTPYTTDCIREGSVLAQDALGDVFLYTAGNMDPEDWTYLSKTKQGVRLWRDYWRYIATRDPIAGGRALSPNENSILSADTKVLV